MIQIVPISLPWTNPFVALLLTPSSSLCSSVGAGFRPGAAPWTRVAFGIILKKQKGGAYAMKFDESKKEISRRYPVTMHFRCSEDERDTIVRRAAETGYSLSTFMRRRATGGRTSKPIQDIRDLSELKQHLGLLKQLVQENHEVRPLLKSLEALIDKMTAKAE